MADMDVAVGVRGAVVKNILFLPFAGVALEDLKIGLPALPLCYLQGLVLRQIGPHGKTALWQV